MRRRSRVVVAAVWFAALTIVMPSAAAARHAAPQLHPVPWSVPGPAGGGLTGVSCWRQGACVAVGDLDAQREQPGVARLSGGSWTAAGLDVPDHVYFAGLKDVSCTSATWCVAVGQTYDDTGRPDRALVASFASGAWSTSVLPLPPGAESLTLGGISCAQRGNCVAAGVIGTSGASRPVVEALSGGTWTSTQPPTTTKRDGELTDVDCPSASHCVAVGSLGAAALVETLANGVWTRSGAATVSAAHEVDLGSVSCPAAGQCAAVGYYRNGSGDEEPLAESLLHGAWSAADLPVPSGALDTESPPAVDCATAGSCVAVGSTTFGALAWTLADGAWTAVPLPAPQADADFVVAAVACPLDAACTAVGHVDGGPFGQGLAEQLRSGAWSAATVGFVGPPSARLPGLACTGADTCVAVGSSTDAAYHDHAFQARRSRVGWATKAIKPFGAAEPEFSGVACPETGSCVAVGQHDVIGQLGLFADVLADGAWTETDLPFPEPTGQIDSVSAPSCPTSTSCVVAVSSDGRFVLDRLSNGTWSEHALPVPKGAWPQVLDLAASCSHPTRCVVTGSYNASGGGGLFAATDAGGTWTTKPIRAAADSSGASLDSLSCPTAGTCVAVGQSANDVSGLWQPLVLRLSGGSWHRTVLPLRGHARNESLASVSCLGVRACTAVGTYTNAAGTVQHGLIESYVDDDWTPVVLANGGDVRSAELDAVSCVAHAPCRAVGTGLGSDGGDHPIATSIRAPG